MSNSQLQLILASMLKQLADKTSDYDQGYRHALAAIQKLLTQQASD